MEVRPQGWDDVVDPRYYCISAEQIDYTPIEWNDLRKKFYKQLGQEIQNS
jgi:hypothetical protein